LNFLKMRENVPPMPAGSNLPKPIRPNMPADYTPAGAKTKFLPWSFAEERLAKSHNYWICSTRQDGRPHSIPVWGVWIARAFYFSTDPNSQKARNLRANPAISVHVESGNEPVILEGRIETAKLDEKIDAAYHEKYKMRLSDMPPSVAIFRLRPKTVLTWREKDFSISATKWKLRK
jgi:general stress protein 26